MRTVDSISGDTRIDVMAGQLRFLVDEAEQRRRRDEAYSELVADLQPVANQGMETMSRLLTEADSRGYTDFVRSGLGVVDKVVSSFDEDDVEALADNVVLILETVKEMTQPEVMQMLRSTLHQVQETEEPEEPPSLFALVRQMRTLEARRGLYRLVVALETLGAEPGISNKRKEAQA